jgi:hypothetical protein
VSEGSSLRRRLIVAGTDAVHSDDPMTPEAAQALSQEILGDMGVLDQAQGADHTGGIPAASNPEAGVTDGAGAPANQPDPQATGLNPEMSPGADSTAAWTNTLPEEVQADLSRLNPATVAQLREIAEGGMRMDDYTRKTQAAARERADAIKKAELAEKMVERLMDKTGAPVEPKNAEPEMPSIKALMETSDPEEFAQGLEAFIAKTVEARTSKQRVESPEYKAKVVDSAASQIHDAIKDKLPEGAWDRATQLFVEHCEQKGVEWYDTPVQSLAMELRPHIRFALAEHAARGPQQPQASDQGTDGMSRPVHQPGVGAAMMPSSGPNMPTAPVAPHVREGREISEDEAYQRTMTRFGVANEAELARLRQMGD